MKTCTSDVLAHSVISKKINNALTASFLILTIYCLRWGTLEEAQEASRYIQV